MALRSQKRGSIPDAPPLASSSPMNAEFQVIELKIPQELAGLRLDTALSRLLPEHSRTRIKGWIDAGQVQVGKLECKPRDKVSAGSRVEVRMSVEAPPAEVQPEAIALAVVHEDRGGAGDRQAGGPGGASGGRQPASHAAKCACSARSAPCAHCRAPASSTGSTRTPAACWSWRARRGAHGAWPPAHARSVSREYLAVWVGVMTGGGTVDEPIGRHRSDRLRMAVRRDGRRAVTHYRVLERFRAHTLLGCKLETGRTHQIRVHLAHLRYPLVGDPVYGGRFARPRGAGESCLETLRRFKRQALHAATSPSITRKPARGSSFETPLPAGFRGAAAGAARGCARRPRRAMRAGSSDAPWITPDWPAPARCARSRRCAAAASAAPYESLNLGEHVGDAPAAVAENRRRCERGRAPVRARLARRSRHAGGGSGALRCTRGDRHRRMPRSPAPGRCSPSWPPIACRSCWPRTGERWPPPTPAGAVWPPG